MVLMIVHLCANIWWLGADNHAIQTDEETHMLTARDYYKALFPQVGDRGLGARLAAVTRIKADEGNPVHPPLLPVAGAVLARGIGYSVDRMAFVNTLAFLAAIIGVYLLARRFLEGGEAFFAALVFSLTPLVYVSSRYFMTDFLSMALTVWAVYALVCSEGFSKWGGSVAFGLITGLSLLARTTGVLYFFVPSLVVFAVGLWKVVVEGSGLRARLDAMGGLLANALIVFLLTAAVAAPWYIANGRQFYHYWTKPNTASAVPPIAMVHYEQDESETPPSPGSATPEAIKEEPENVKLQPEAGGWRFRLERRVPWVRYPVMIINNAVFLPMFGMFLLGVAACAVCRRFRRKAMPWLLLAWALGSYVLLTLALSFAAPRYVMQLLPALALLSALPVLALPKGLLRLAAQFLYVAVLMFQYGNLTVHAYGPAAEAKIPVYADAKFQKIYDDHGLYFFKPVLRGSFSYGRMQAPMTENFKDRLFFAMLKTEQERPYYGIEALYARLNMRGMILDEEHFWSNDAGGNPFLRHDIPPDLVPVRKFKSFGWAKDLENLLPALILVDYVAYSTEGITPDQEQAWLKTMGEHGFEPVERFYEERFGMVPARWFGLLARKPAGPLPAARTAAEIQALDMDDLYKLRHSAAFGRLDEEARAAVAERMRVLREAWGTPVPLNDQADYCHARIDRYPGDYFLYSLYFHTREPMPESCKILLQGRVSPEDMKHYFEDDSGNFHEFEMLLDPAIPPRLWPENELVLVRFLGGMHPIPCQMRFALYTPGEGLRSNIINLGPVDFGAMRPLGE